MDYMLTLKRCLHHTASPLVSPLLVILFYLHEQEQLTDVINKVRTENGNVKVLL